MKLNPKQQTPIKLSVIIPYTGHDPLREKALNDLIEVLKNQDICEIEANGEKAIIHEIIFVEQRTSKNYIGHFFDSDYVTHYWLEYEGPFNKSWCMNFGARKANGKWLLFIDADMLFGKNYLSAVRDYYELSNCNFFIGWTYIVTMIGKDNPFIRVINKNITLTAGGSFFITKEFFFETGGMNETYFGYGGEDNDFWIRAAELMKSHPPYIDTVLVHQYHDWAEPNPIRIDLLDKTNQNKAEVTRRLKVIGTGKQNCPSPIDVSDLKLSKQGISGGEGLI